MTDPRTIWAETPTDGPGYFEQVRAGDIEVIPGLNPRRRFDEAKLVELTESVRTHGIRQPINLHVLSDNGRRFYVIAGERRWRAAMAVGPDTPVPAMLKRYTEEEALEVALIENLDRDDRTPIEEARGFRALLARPGMTQRVLAEKIGRTQPYISNRIRLLELPDEVLELVEDGRILLSHARDLLVPFTKIPEKKRAKLFAEVCKRARGARDTMDDWEIRNVVSQIAISLSRPVTHAAYREEEPEFSPKTHEKCTCNGPKFEYHGEGEVRCFDDEWWEAAQKKAVERRVAREKKAAEAAAAKNGDGGTAVEVISADAAQKRFGWGGKQRVDRELVDASLLAGAPLIVAKPQWKGNQPEVHCADASAIRRARAAVKKERGRLLAERRAARAEKYRATAEASELEPWMLAQILLERPHGNELLTIGREIGIDVGKMGDLQKAVRKLPDADILLLTKVCALRSKANDIHEWNDPLTNEVDATLRRKYGPGARALEKRALKAAGLWNGGKGNQAEPGPDPADVDEEMEGGLVADGEAQCIECGCTDSAACPEGCSWLAVDRERGAGVCTSCASDEGSAKAMLADAVLA